MVRPSSANQSATYQQGFQVESTPLNLRCHLLAGSYTSATPGRENRPPEAQLTIQTSRNSTISTLSTLVISRRRRPRHQKLPKPDSVFHHIRSIVTTDRLCSPKKLPRVFGRAVSWSSSWFVRRASFTAHEIPRHTKTPFSTVSRARVAMESRC